HGRIAWTVRVGEAGLRLAQRATRALAVDRTVQRVVDTALGDRRVARVAVAVRALPAGIVAGIARGAGLAAPPRRLEGAALVGLLDRVLTGRPSVDPADRRDAVAAHVVHLQHQIGGAALAAQVAPVLVGLVGEERDLAAGDPIRESRIARLEL